MQLAAPAWDGESLRLSEVSGAVAVCTAGGDVVGLTPSARALLTTLGVGGNIPFPLPATLRESILQAPPGVATEWVPDASGACARLGCTRYAAGQSHMVLLMREVSEKQRELSRLLHQQRLEAMGRLIATIAHDLRSGLGPIVFNSGVLLERSGNVPRSELRELVREIASAGAALKRLVDNLLDFARLGPPMPERVSIANLVHRATVLVGGVLRERGTKVEVAAAPEHIVIGNSITIVQSLVNVLVNASESNATQVLVESACDPREEQPWVVVRVHDDGPGVPEGIAGRIFEPFFSTKTTGTGLGLPAAREGLRGIGGDIALGGPSKLGGSTFAIWLPGAQADGDER